MASQEMIEIVKDVCEIGRIFEAIAKADGTMAKISAALMMTDEIARLLSMDALKIKTELANMSDKDIDDLKTVFDHNFDLQDDLMEEMIEKGCDVLIQLGAVIQDAIDLGKKVVVK